MRECARGAKLFKDTAARHQLHLIVRRCPILVNRSSNTPVPGCGLPIGNHAIVSTKRAIPRDSLIGPESRLDMPKARTALGPATASDTRSRQETLGRGRRDYGSEVLSQVTPRGQETSVEPTRLVDKVTQIAHPRVAYDSPHIAGPRYPPNAALSRGVRIG
jgi:hypothetical protein